MKDSQRKAMFARLTKPQVKQMKENKVEFDNDRREASIKSGKPIHVFDMTPFEFHNHQQDMASDNCNFKSKGGQCIKHKGHSDPHWIKREDTPQPKFWEQSQ